VGLQSDRAAITGFWERADVDRGGGVCLGARNIKRMRRISLISVFYLCNLLHKYNAIVLLSS